MNKIGNAAYIAQNVRIYVILKKRVKKLQNNYKLMEKL